MDGSAGAGRKVSLPQVGPFHGGSQWQAPDGEQTPLSEHSAALTHRPAAPTTFCILMTALQHSRRCDGVECQSAVWCVCSSLRSGPYCYSTSHKTETGVLPRVQRLRDVSRGRGCEPPVELARGLADTLRVVRDDRSREAGEVCVGVGKPSHTQMIALTPTHRHSDSSNANPFHCAPQPSHPRGTHARDDVHGRRETRDFRVTSRRRRRRRRCLSCSCAHGHACTQQVDGFSVSSASRQERARIQGRSGLYKLPD